MRRGKERLGSMSFVEMVEINNAIKEGHAVHVESQSLRVSLKAVKTKKGILLVAYDRKREQVITVLPKDSNKYLLLKDALKRSEHLLKDEAQKKQIIPRLRVRTPPSEMEDLTGQKRGRIEIIGYMKKGKWLARCKCGNYTYRNGSSWRKNARGYDYGCPLCALFSDWDKYPMKEEEK